MGSSNLQQELTFIFVVVELKDNLVRTDSTHVLCFQCGRSCFIHELYAMNKVHINLNFFLNVDIINNLVELNMYLSV